MAEIRCFLLEPTAISRRWLRRYRNSNGGANPCPLTPGQYSYHNALAPIEDAAGIIASRSYEREPEADEFRGDPRWPTHCACGEPFGDDDQWQLFTRRLYCRIDTSEVMTLEDAPPGAMWRAPWMGYAGPDGECYILKTPGGDWTIDGPSSNADGSTGPGWHREGTAPNFTVTPSIGKLNADGSWRYHGWLRDGVLVDA